jgi:hypothetical protein
LDSSAGTIDHYFEHNLLTVSSIDPILLSLASKFCWDDVSAVGKCFHDRLAQRLSRVLNSRYKPILAKKIIGLPFTPPPVAPSVLQGGKKGSWQVAVLLQGDPAVMAGGAYGRAPPADIFSHRIQPLL